MLIFKRKTPPLKPLPSGQKVKAYMGGDIVIYAAIESEEVKMLYRSSVYDGKEAEHQTIVTPEGSGFHPIDCMAAISDEEFNAHEVEVYWEGVV